MAIQSPLPIEMQTELGKGGGGGTQRCNVTQNWSASLLHTAAYKAEDNQKKTWMKNRPHSSLRIFISQEKGPRLHPSPFPKPSP